MNLKKHFVKRHVFMILFLILLFGFSATNFWYAKDELWKKITDATWDFEHISENISAVEDAIGENVLGKMELIETYGFLQEIMDKKENNDFAFVKDDNGMLYYSDFENQIPPYLEDNVNQAKEIAELAGKYGSTTFAIIYPDRYGEEWVQTEPGLPVQDFTEINDEWKAGLIEAEIPVIDVRPALEEAGLTGEKLFYKTDHHWRVEAAYVAYCDFVAQMNTMFGEHLDEAEYYRDMSNYNVYTYEQTFLGSMGRETGIIYSGLDDFTVIYPKFATNYERTYYMAGEIFTEEGSFEETIFNSNYLNNDNVYANDIYSCYFDGVLIYDRVENRNCPDGPKILWIRDSYASPLAAFTSLSASEMDMIWSINYEDDVETLLAENEYDYVIISIAGMNLTNEDLFLFMKE